MTRWEPCDITVDYETIEQGSACQDGDTMRQIGVPTGELAYRVQTLLSGCLKFEDAGAPVSTAKEQ
jgi:hypothetical protein